MGKDALRRCNPRRHQKGRPIDGVKAHDVLADEMRAGRPEFPALGVCVWVAGGGDVISQRIKPDIHHMRGIARHLDAPGEAGPRNGKVEFLRLFREILEPLQHKGAHFIAPRFGLHINPLGMAFRQIKAAQQFGQPFGQAKEIRWLPHPFHRRARWRVFHSVAFGQFIRAVKRLITHRIPAFIMAQVNLIAPGQFFPKRGTGGLVARFRGADEIIIGKAERRGQVAEMLADLIREGLRFHPRIARGLFHLLAMLIRAGQEKHLMARQPPPARQHIRRHRGIGVAHMRLVIHIINGRGDVARFCHLYRP